MQNIGRNEGHHRFKDLHVSRIQIRGLAKRSAFRNEWRLIRSFLRENIHNVSDLHSAAKSMQIHSIKCIFQGLQLSFIVRFWGFLLMQIHFAIFVMHRNTSYIDNSLVKFSIPNTALTNFVRPLQYASWKIFI